MHTHEQAAAVLAAMRAGRTQTEAAHIAGVPAPTVRSWVSQGRKNPEGKWREWAEAAARSVPVHTGTTPGRDELLTLLGQRAREGNMRAIELLLRETGSPLPSAQTDASDPFAEVDELASRRSNRK